MLHMDACTPGPSQDRVGCSHRHGYLVETLRQDICLGGQALHIQPLLQRMLRLGSRGLPTLSAQRCSPLCCRKRLGVGLPLRKVGVDVGSLCTTKMSHMSSNWKTYGILLLRLLRSRNHSIF